MFTTTKRSDCDQIFRKKTARFLNRPPIKVIFGQRVGKSHKLIDLSVKETSTEEVEIEGIN